MIIQDYACGKEATEGEISALESLLACNYQTTAKDGNLHDKTSMKLRRLDGTLNVLSIHFECSFSRLN